MLESLIIFKTRLRLLVKFFVNDQNRRHLRVPAEEFGESADAVRKEPKYLSGTGILLNESNKNKIADKADTLHPYFTHIQETIGRYLVLARIPDRMGAVVRVVLAGDIARGTDTGAVDRVVTGDRLNRDCIRGLK
jgi:hypothetical protein